MMRHRVSQSIALLAVAAALWQAPAPASAEGMSFTLDETGQSARKLPKPSKALAKALSLYQQERFEEAALGFRRVADGKTRDRNVNRQRAQFFLGKSLYRLRYYQGALTVFDDISQTGPKHRYFSDSLQWLAQLALQLPEPAGIIEKVGRYGVGAIEGFKTEENSDLYNLLLYLMGRHLYGEGEFKEAIKLFQEVDPKSPPYVYARFFEGIAHIRRRKARPAIASFRAIIEALDKGVKGVDDEERMRNLAWVSLARVYYTAANQGVAKGKGVDGVLLGQAVESWTKVGQSSEYWLDALFESSWAFFLADEYSRALGNVHSLYSPFFGEAYYPEALVLKGVTFFVNCQAENAEAVVSQFHERFDPVKKELDEILARNQDNAQFFEFLEQVRSGKADISPRVRAIVATAISDRTVLRHLEYVSMLNAEAERVNSASKEFQSSPIGGQILQDVELARSFAIDQAGDLVRGRYRRLIRELQDLSNQVDTVELEIATYQRGQIDQELQQQLTELKDARGGDVNVDEEHQLWPFDGEYWRDELGFYRQQVTNRCGR